MPPGWLVPWVVFSILAVLGLLAALLWALAARQFGDQERARRLPLEAGRDARRAPRPRPDPRPGPPGTPGGGGKDG